MNVRNEEIILYFFRLVFFFKFISRHTVFVVHFSCPLRKGDLEMLKSRFPVTEALWWRCACASGLTLGNNTCRKMREAGPSRGETASVVAMEELDDECQLQWWALYVSLISIHFLRKQKTARIYRGTVPRSGKISIQGICTQAVQKMDCSC